MAVDIFEKQNITIEEPGPRDIFLDLDIEPSINEQNQGAINNVVKLKDNNVMYQGIPVEDENIVGGIKQNVYIKDNEIERLSNYLFTPEELQEIDAKGPVSWIEGFQKVKPSEYLPFGGLKQAYDAGRLLTISKNIEAGKDVSEDDREYLRQTLREDVELQRRGMSFGGMFTHYGSQIPAFMVEFAATGGIGKVAGTAATKATAKAALNVAKKGVLKTIKRGAIKTAGASANIAARTIAMPARYIPAYAENQISDNLAVTDKGELILQESQEKPATSFFKAFLTTGIEVGSEMSGAAIGSKIIKPIGNKAFSLLPVNVQKSFINGIREIKPLQSVEALFKKGGFDGILEEYGEERLADLLNTAFDLDPEQGHSLDQYFEALFPDKEQVLLELGLFSTIGATSIASSSITKNLKKVGKSAAEIDNILKNTSALEKEELLQKLQAPTSEVKTQGDAKTPDEIKTPQNEAQNLQESNFDNFYSNWVNKLNPIENLEKSALERTNLKPSERPALLARMFAGSVGATKQQIENNTFVVDEAGNIEITGEGFRPIIKDFDFQMSGIESNQNIRQQDLKDYLIAQRFSLDLAVREDINVTDEQKLEAIKTLANLTRKYGEHFTFFEDYAGRIYKYQQRILYNLVSGGNISQEQYDTILKQNPHYIPFNRVFEEESTGAISPKSKFSDAKASKVVKKIKGSEREIQDPFENILRNTFKTLDVSYKNRVARSVANLTEIMPEYIQKAKTPMKKIQVENEQGNLIETYRPADYKPRGNIIEYYKEGKRQYIEVSKPIYEALNDLSPAQLGFIEKLFTVPAQIFRAGATIMPDFWIRNVMRDQQTALIQTDVKFVPFVDMAKGMMSLIKKDRVYQEWMSSGGSFNSYMDLSDKSMQQAMKELIKPEGKISKYLRTFGFAALEDASMSFEQATRIGIFKKGKDAGLSSTEAAYTSREGTLDFARVGKTGKILNRYLPFFNAGIQGTDKLIRTFRDNTKIALLWGSATIAFPSVLLAGYYLYAAPDEDRKEYLEIPQWQKDLFWCVKVGDNWWRYPKPFALGYLFGSVPERLINWLYQGDKPEGEKLWQALTGLLNSVTPINDVGGVMPPTIRTIVENTSNYNFFTGRSIYPDWMTRLEPTERKNKYTSETAQLLGEQFNVSPALVENALRGTFATSTSYILDAGDTIINSVKKWNGEDIPEKPITLSDIAVIRSLAVRSPEGSRSVSTHNFYENWKQVQEKHATFSNKKGEEKQAYLEKNLDYITAYKGLKNFNKQISGLNKQIDIIYSDKNMSAQEKAQNIYNIERQITEISQNANDWMDKHLNKRDK